MKITESAKFHLQVVRVFEKYWLHIKDNIELVNLLETPRFQCQVKFSYTRIEVRVMYEGNPIDVY